MTVQVKVNVIDGRILHGINYRMASYAPSVPSVTASPYPFLGGVYHLQSALGWIDVLQSEVSAITLSPVAHS